MNSPDPASLQNLNDIVLPETVSWWPLANGWYVLAAVFLITISWFAYRSARRWLRNRYRRVALQELRLLEEKVHGDEGANSCLWQISTLLKRTALCVYSREQVASLSGGDWHQFLNSTLDKPVFNTTIGATLDRTAYSPGNLEDIDPQALKELLDASRHWLQSHRPTTVRKHRSVV